MVDYKNIEDATRYNDPPVVDTSKNIDGAKHICVGCMGYHDELSHYFTMDINVSDIMGVGTICDVCVNNESVVVDIRDLT